MAKASESTFELQVQGMLYWVALFSMTAGLIHGIASTMYWAAWWGYAAFFLLVALAQVAAGLVLFIQPWRYDSTGGIRQGALHYARPFFVAGISFNGVLVVLWLVSRIVDLSLTAEATMRVPVTALGALASLIEVAIVFYLVRWVRAIDRLKG